MKTGTRILFIFAQFGDTIVTKKMTKYHPSKNPETVKKIYLKLPF